MSDLKLSVILAAVDRLTAPVRRIAAATRQAFAPLNQPLKQLQTAMWRLGAEAAKLGGRLVIVGGIAAAAFNRLFLSTARVFERYRVQLESLEGSSANAERAMKWIDEFTMRVPFELDAVTDAYVQLRTFGLDPMDGTMQALMDQSAKMGGSQATMQGIILAVGQAWTKQKLQGEEALQLIERGVPVWDLLSAATGKSARTLQELSEKGKLGRGAIKLLIEEMGKSSAGAALAQTKTWDGMIGTLSKQWMRFVTLVMENGVFDWLKARLSGLINTVNAWADSGRLQELAREVGDRLVQSFKTLWAVLQEVWAVVGTIGAGLRWLHDLFGSWKPVMIGVAAVIAGPLLLALASATAAIAKLGFVLLTTPVGWILAAVAAIAGAVYLIYRNWDGISAWFTSLWDGIVETVGGSIAKMMDWLETFGKVVMMPFDTLFMLYEKAKSLLPGGLLKTIGLGGQAATLGGAQKSEIGGTIRVQVDSEGRARVREVQASGGIGIEAETGYAFGGG